MVTAPTCFLDNLCGQSYININQFFPKYQKNRSNGGELNGIEYAFCMSTREFKLRKRLLNIWYSLPYTNKASFHRLVASSSWEVYRLQWTTRQSLKIYEWLGVRLSHTETEKWEHTSSSSFSLTKSRGSGCMAPSVCISVTGRRTSKPSSRARNAPKLVVRTTLAVNLSPIFRLWVGVCGWRGPLPPGAAVQTSIKT